MPQKPQAPRRISPGVYQNAGGQVVRPQGGVMPKAPMPQAKPSMPAAPMAPKQPITPPMSTGGGAPQMQQPPMQQPQGMPAWGQTGMNPGMQSFGGQGASQFNPYAQQTQNAQMQANQAMQQANQAQGGLALGSQLVNQMGQPGQANMQQQGLQSAFNQLGQNQNPNGYGSAQ